MESLWFVGSRVGSRPFVRNRTSVRGQQEYRPEWSKRLWLPGSVIHVRLTRDWGTLICAALLLHYSSNVWWLSELYVSLQVRVRVSESEKSSEYEWVRFFFSLSLSEKFFLKILSIYRVSRFWLVCTKNWPHNWRNRRIPLFSWLIAMQLHSY